jgi:hypothetical protein
MAGENEPVDDLIEQVPDSEASADTAPPVDDKPPVEDKPAAKTEPPKQQQQPPKRDVPLATFLEEKRKFTEALDKERTEREKLQKQLEALVNPPKAAPKFAENPEGYIEHATKASAKEVLAALEETNKGLATVKEKTEQDKQREAHNQFLEELGTMEEQFVQTQPDYHHALAHVRRLSFAQMKEFYPDATEQQIMRAIDTQEINMARQAMATGRNPHELAYRLAVVNGYVKKAPADPKGKPNAKAPDIKGDTVLDPDLSLGKSGGEAPPSGEDDVFDPDKGDVFDEALKEMFGRKRA